MPSSRARIKIQDAVVVAVIFAVWCMPGHDKYTFSYLKCSQQKSQIALTHAMLACRRARLLKPLDDASVDSNSNIVAKIGGCISGELLYLPQPKPKPNSKSKYLPKGWKSSRQ